MSLGAGTAFEGGGAITVGYTRCRLAEGGAGGGRMVQSSIHFVPGVLLLDFV